MPPRVEHSQLHTDFQLLVELERYDHCCIDIRDSCRNGIFRVLELDVFWEGVIDDEMAYSYGCNCRPVPGFVL